MASRSRRSRVSTDKRLRKISCIGDYGTPERWQHSGRALEITDCAGVLAARATEEHILDVLAIKSIVSQIQVAAGLKFKADYVAASMSANVTGSYTGMASARDFFNYEYERTDAQEAAYVRWRSAVRELGLDCGSAVIETVCYDAAPSPRDVAALQVGLDRLVAWYKMGKR